MSKETSKKAKAEKNKKYPACSFYLQVIGSGAPGAPVSLYAAGGQSAYLFNCGEGTQRLAYEHKVKLSTVQNIFVTHKSWRNIGGLPGALLTLQDSGTDFVKLHGPPGLHALYEDTRSFMSFDAMDLSYHHYSTNDGVVGDKDDPLVITAVPILPASQKGASPAVRGTEFVVFKGGSDPGRGCKRDSTEEPNEDEAASVKRSKSDEFVTDMAMLYIGKLSPKLGKLLLELCVKAKVPPGPLYGQLKNGQDVVLADGSVVRAADVTEPDDPGPVFIVVEAPTMDHLETLASHPSLAPYQAPDTENTAEVVVHFTPLRILRTPEYKKWMESFAPCTQHILINEGNTCNGSQAVHRNQIKLNRIHPTLYPLLADRSIPDLASNSLKNEGNDHHLSASSEGNGVSVEKSNGSALERRSPINAVTMMTYHIRPRHGLSRDLCPVIDRESIEKEILDTGCKPDVPVELPKEYPEVTFLGTGSAIPNKTRNVSGILVEMSADKFMLLDCGEGTVGQLVKLVGVARAHDILTKLRGVYISHHHADHHIGLVSVMQRRKQALIERGLPLTPLLVLAPSLIVAYLRSYHLYFEPIASDHRLIFNNYFFNGRESLSQELTSVVEELGLADIRTCFVPHCKESFGVRITTLEGKSLVYSGDTRPCDMLVNIGRGCDVLIHEATMEDYLTDEARAKRHCTVSEALSVARRMEAKYILLTHFSQRYSKVPLVSEDSDYDVSNVAFAFDFMRVTPSGIPVAAALYPKLCEMFAEYIEALKDKTAKKIMGQERKNKIQAGAQN